MKMDPTPSLFFFLSWYLFMFLAFQAANQGAKFKGRMLQISWYKPKTPSVTTEPEEEEAKDEDSTVGEVTQLLDSFTHLATLGAEDGKSRIFNQ